MKLAYFHGLIHVSLNSTFYILLNILNFHFIIIFRVAITIVLSTGAINFREVNNVREDFSAINAPSRYEYAVTQDFFKNFGSPFHLVVVFEAMDGGSLLRPGFASLVIIYFWRYFKTVKKAILAIL